MDESGRLKVLVSEKAMQIKFRDDIAESREYGACLKPVTK